MPDITMCFNADCDRKHDCYRYMARPSLYQSYSEFSEDCKKNDYRNFIEILDKEYFKGLNS